MQKIFNRYYCVYFFSSFFLFFSYNIHHQYFSSFLSNEEIRSWPARQRRRGNFSFHEFFAYLFFFIYLSIDFLFASSIVFHSFFNPRLPKKEEMEKLIFFLFRSGKHFTFQSFFFSCSSSSFFVFNF